MKTIKALLQNSPNEYAHQIEEQIIENIQKQDETSPFTKANEKQTILNAIIQCTLIITILLYYIYHELKHQNKNINA